GDMVAFFLFLQMFQQPFQQIGQISSIIQSALASGERIYELINEPEMEVDSQEAIASEDGITGEIIFDNVEFSYTPDKPLIQNFNLKVNTGDSIAIVGPTGAGKTTIVNLIMRFYEVNSGRILLDGIDIRNYKRGILRGAVGMVLQDTWLFADSIRENIRYGRSDATDGDIEEAAKQAHADHFIKTLPGGYDFMLNEDGTNISQGQRQLITIARAIVSKPKILILDEATSSVDTRTELAIQDAMNKMMVGKTSFIIAHRLSTIKNAKVIIVMQKGQIVEIGSHSELLANNGFYAELYNAQFSGRNPLAEPDQENGIKQEMGV
ncbi:MAG TPA: ABC transporter ATP-binding protein, partial [Bacilli bacterium]|nr:ABC transporter ATP-binding protein [Bacilli bacterium]